MAAVTHTNERVLVFDHLLDAEPITWVVVERSSDFTCGVAQQNLTLVCANKNLATIEPAVGRIILRNVAVLLLIYCACLQGQIVVLFLEIFVCLLTSDKQNIWV